MNRTIARAQTTFGIYRRAFLMCLFAGIFCATTSNVTPAAEHSPTAEINLLNKYPTSLTEGDANPDHARVADFAEDDIYFLSEFTLHTGPNLKIDCGPADLGVGHCADGAVWAVVIPRDKATLARDASKEPERVEHIWLRFHPAEVSKLFPPTSVASPGDKSRVSLIRAIANHKMGGSWHAGWRAMIPGVSEKTVDVDITTGVRRFFMVNSAANTAEYVSAFEKGALRKPPQVTAELMQQTFDRIWEAFDRNYAMFAIRPDVDWSKLREEKRAQALASRSAYEFADACASLLKPLRDLHVWLTLAGADIPVFNRPRSSNSNPAAHKAILGQLNQEGRRVLWAETTNKIGFLRIDGWDDEETPNQCAKILEKFRNTRGLIIDVRLNGGGSEDLAKEVASRFIKEHIVYAFSQFRNGPNHTNLTERFPRELSPQGPWRYDRPVLVLIGEKCMSSNESFAAMMSKDPDAVLMGEHTCGSSGNPQIIELPLEMTVSVPKWIDYLPDGSPLDEVGVQPQIRFVPEPGAFAGERDDLLTAALARLATKPLPSKPIEGAPFLSPEEAENQDSSRPQVLSVFPQDGAAMVESNIKLRIRFDRPMDPLSMKLDWKTGGFTDFEFPEYDKQRNEFTIQVRLIPRKTHEVTLNGVEDRRVQFWRKLMPHDGFQGIDRKLARLFTWKFETRDEPIANGQTPKVIKFLPPSGTSVPFRLFPEIQFDQAMKTPDQRLPYTVGGGGINDPALVPDIQYDSARHSFKVPMILPPGKRSAFALAGFYSSTGKPADPIQIEYLASGEELSQEDRSKQETARQDPKLIKTLQQIQKVRRKMTAIAEHVQTVQAMSLGALKDCYTRLESKPAFFAWKSPNQYYADVSDFMAADVFAVGSDGNSWWWHESDGGKTNLEIYPLKDIQELNISVCDPFGLTKNDPEEAIQKLSLHYLDSSDNFDRIEAWHIDRLPNEIVIATEFQWTINRKSGLPSEIRSASLGFVSRTRFLHEPTERSFTEVPKIEGIDPTGPKPLEAGYDRRFVDLSDGSNGQISLRWGQRGPKGQSGSGLN